MWHVCRGLLPSRQSVGAPANDEPADVPHAHPRARIIRRRGIWWSSSTLVPTAATACQDPPAAAT